MRRGVASFASVVVLLVLPGVAAAHGDLKGTSPEDGSTVGKVPKEITVALTEPPTQGAEAKATDGCKKKVPAAVSVDGNDIVLSLGGGEPGKWKVSYRAVSAEDGHQTRGSFAFSASGRKDCSPAPDDDPEDDVDAGGDPGIIDNPDPPDEGTSWLLWVGAGTLILVAAAFVVRRSAGR